MRHSVSTAMLALVLGAACKTEAPARLPLAEPLVLAGSDGRAHDLRAEIARSTLTVFVFYSQSCPCLRVHEPRLRALAEAYRGRGVSLLIVDSEVGAEPATDAAAAKQRAYPFALLTDRGAKLAKAVHARFATHAVVVDASGAIRYSGGIDSDKNRLHEDARPYLRQALDEILAGREPPVRDREPLGCALELD
ncbi:MAG TPA: redoxin family protein [Polyangiaceae bacterium]|nr:redoxin family protein [Polyangiaceae bacterium]